MDSLDVGPKGAQFDFHAVVATVEVVDAVDQRLAIGHEAGDHQTGRGTQVGGHDCRALQCRHTTHHRSVAGDLDIRPQTLQFQRMHEAILEDGLGDDAGAFGNGVSSSPSHGAMGLAEQGWLVQHADNVAAQKRLLQERFGVGAKTVKQAVAEAGLELRPLVNIDLMRASSGVPRPQSTWARR